LIVFNRYAGRPPAPSLLPDRVCPYLGGSQPSAIGRDNHPVPVTNPTLKSRSGHPERVA
jgi:hypothetical protein